MAKLFGFVAILCLSYATEMTQFPHRSLSTTITALSDGVTGVADSSKKYCKSEVIDSATGYCGDSDEVTSNGGLGTNIVGTDDSSLFPNNTRYTFGPVAEAESYGGINGIEEINIDNGRQTIINTYRIAAGEVCYYLINIYDNDASEFWINLISATDVNVTISEYNSNTNQRKNEVQLSIGTTYTQSGAVGDQFMILVLPLVDATTGVLMSIDSKVTSSTDTMSTQDIVVLCVVITVLGVLLIASIVLVGKVACGDHYTPPLHRLKHAQEYDEVLRTETNRTNRNLDPKINGRASNYIEKSDSSLDYKRNKTGGRK